MEDSWALRVRSNVLNVVRIELVTRNVFLVQGWKQDRGASAILVVTVEFAIVTG